MEALICDACGGSLVSDNKGEYFICEFCGTKHTQSRVQTKLQEIKGVVEVYSGNQEKERSFDVAANLLNSGNKTEANGYYKELCKKYPDDYRSWLGVIETSKTISDYPNDWITSQGSFGYDALKAELLLTKEFKMAISLAPEELKTKIHANQERRNNEFELISLNGKLKTIDNNITSNNNAKKLAKERKETAENELSKVSTAKTTGWTFIAIGVGIIFVSYLCNSPVVFVGILAIIIGIVILCNTNETYISNKYSNDSKIDMSSYASKEQELQNERTQVANRIKELETILKSK